MDNQHRQIKGYRDFDQATVDLINETKAHGEQLAVLLDKIAARTDIDPRWLAIARTDLQKGIMGAVRAIAKPDSF